MVMESLSPGCPRPQKMPPPSKGKKAESRLEAASERSDATAILVSLFKIRSLATIQFEPVCFTGGVSYSINSTEQ